jgi:hypothetical protein
MERTNLICCLLGWYCGRNPNILGEDLKILIDQHLIQCNLGPLTTQDIALLEELLADQMVSVMGAGMNREMRRMLRR